MALGIERDTVGDIIPLEKTATVFVNESISDFVISQIDKISSAGVVVERDEAANVQVELKFLEKSETIASNRLDCVISALINCSRGKAVEIIESGFVSVDGIEALKSTKCLTKGSKITVRKIGKFVVDGISDTTKKGRIVLKYRKYL
jgi:RNA-binding protein YlmH